MKPEPIKELNKSLNALLLELPEFIIADLRTRIKAAKSEYCKEQRKICAESIFKIPVSCLNETNWDELESNIINAHEPESQIP